MTPIRLHPERTADPDVLRWSTAPATVPKGGLDALIDDGVLVGVDIAAGRVDTRLAPGQSWHEAGGRVRSALLRALRETERAPAVDDDELRRAVAARLEDRVAPFAASHGGRLRVASVHDGVVTIEFGGACLGCPAAAATLESVVAAELAALPAVRKVRAAAPPGGRATVLARLRRRR